MKSGVLFSVVVSLLGCSSSPPSPVPTPPAKQQPMEHGHHEHETTTNSEMLMVSTDPAQVEAGKPVQLHLMVHGADGRLVKEFETIHEKRIHLIVVRDGLDQFAHVHPDLDGKGNITISHTFPVGGKYRLYADHKSKDSPETTSIAELEVQGESPQVPQLVPNAPGKVIGDSLDAKVVMEQVEAGKPAMITFDLSDKADKAVNDLQPYLGAMGHLVIISADGQQYVHAHPEESGQTQNRVAFMAHFKSAGIYKAWGQFQRQGKVATIPFVIEVK